MNLFKSFTTIMKYFIFQGCIPVVSNNTKTEKVERACTHTHTNPLCIPRTTCVVSLHSGWIKTWRGCCPGGTGSRDAEGSNFTCLSPSVWPMELASDWTCLIAHPIDGNGRERKEEEPDDSSLQRWNSSEALREKMTLHTTSFDRIQRGLWILSHSQMKSRGKPSPWALLCSNTSL